MKKKSVKKRNAKPEPIDRPFTIEERKRLRLLVQLKFSKGFGDFASAACVIFGATALSFTQRFYTACPKDEAKKGVKVSVRLLAACAAALEMEFDALVSAVWNQVYQSPAAAVGQVSQPTVASVRPPHPAATKEVASHKQTGSNLELRIGGIADVKAMGWSAENLLERLIEIDHATIPNLTDLNEGNVDQWKNLFWDRPLTWAVLLSGNTIVGYWHWLPLEKAAFDLAKRGKLHDSKITRDDVAKMDSLERLNAYFVSIGALEEFRDGDRARRLLFTSLMANIEQLAIERQFIDEVCAVAFPSPDSYGKRMTKVFGMKKVAKYGKEGEVYTLRLLPANAQSKFWNVPGTRGEDRLFKLYSAVG